MVGKIVERFRKFFEQVANVFNSCNFLLTGDVLEGVFCENFFGCQIGELNERDFHAVGTSFPKRVEVGVRKAECVAHAFIKGFVEGSDVDQACSENFLKNLGIYTPVPF